MIIGVGGSLASGKDTVANYLQGKGFIHYSLSDILREELKKQNKEVTRKNLQLLGNDLRTKYGPGILAWKTLIKLNHNQNHIISSIGTEGEVEVLKQREDFNLIFVDSPQKLRFERLLARNREKDPKTFNEFKIMEELESKGGGGHFRAHNKIKKLSNKIIINDSSLGKFHGKIDKVLEDLKFKLRPSWEEYFISIMKAVGSRGTCNRGKAGCVIVKDKRILSTGYAGAPTHLPHCDEVGHQMESTIHSDGIERKHCVRTTHAEQNAIVQASKHGISIDGSSIYVKMEPCPACTKMIINSGITEVICEKQYHAAQESRKLLKQAGIKLKVLHNEVENYSNQ